MTAREFEQFVARTDGWYQGFSVGHVRLPGIRDTAAEAWVLPVDLHGQRVLDAGCAEGYFPMLAAARGAEAFGIDWDIAAVERATTVAQMVGSPATFAHVDLHALDQWHVAGVGFDVVLCMSMLHHSRHPKDVLAQIRGATRRRLILEVECDVPGHRPLHVLPDMAELGVSAPRPTTACILDALLALFADARVVGPNKAHRVVFEAITNRAYTAFEVTR